MIEKLGALRRVAIPRRGAVAVAVEESQRHERLSKKSGLARGCNCSADCSSAPVFDVDPSSLNNLSSIADSRTFAGQNAMPTSMIRAGDAVVMCRSPSCLR
jgi:hypothetical protein